MLRTEFLKTAACVLGQLSTQNSVLFTFLSKFGEEGPSAPSPNPASTDASPVIVCRSLRHDPEVRTSRTIGGQQQTTTCVGADQNLRQRVCAG